MKRWVLLWRFYHRNKVRFKRICSVALTILFVGAAGYAVVSVVRSDREKVEAASREAPEQESPFKADPTRDYGEPGLKKTAETQTRILYADITTGEVAVEDKSNGFLWYSNPPDREEDTYAPQKSRLASQLVLTYFTPGNSKTVSVDSYTGCVSQGGLDYKLVEGGIRFFYTFPKIGLRIPVEYTIRGDEFAMEILLGEIEEYLPEKNPLISIDVLPFFGAGGLEDTGYLFVPDGSGALIYYNNEKQRFLQYSAPVYGKDYVKASSTEFIKNEQITMPVFGLKTGEYALLAVITGNEEYATITATTSKKTSAYNQVYSTVAYRDYSVPNSNMANGHNEVRYSEYTEPFTEKSYRVEYHLLNGDAANYSGMACEYREYLREKGELKQSELAEKPYFVVNLYGAVSMEKYVFGFKKPVVTALTPYQDVIRIVKELKDRQIDSIIVNYIGAMEGGLNTKLMDHFATESVLGSKKDFQEMLTYLEQENVLFFVEQDPVHLYRDGNGYTQKEDVTTSFYGQSASLYDYSLNQRRIVKSTRRNLVKPSLLPKVMSNFFSSAKKNGIANYSAAGIGGILYSDYNVKDAAYRETSVLLWREALEDASQEFAYVMLEKGNAYCFPYVDMIRDIAVEDSGYDMIDESVPFYQMVVRGNLALSSSALNLNVDYYHQYLKGLETGTNMSYTWIGGDVLSLVGTEYNDLVSVGIEYWIDTAAEEYNDAREVMELTAGREITGHRKVAENVFETTYEGGVRVYVNYGESEYRDGNMTVAARGFSLVR